jgi:hypothetical protein
MDDEKFKPKLGRRFDVPEIARERAQQWINAGGDPFAIDQSLDMLGDELPELTEKQRLSIYENLDDGGKRIIDSNNKRLDRTVQRWVDKGMNADEIAERKASSKLFRQQKLSHDRTLMAQALDNDHYNSGGKYIENRKTIDSKLNPNDVFQDKRKGAGKGGAVNRIDEKLNQIKADRLAKETEARKPRLASVADAPADMAKQKNLAKFIREGGMKLVKKGGPKLAALLGGPIGWGIAGISTLMDANDAYAATESAMNPTNPREEEVQRMLAEAIRNPTEYEY